MLATKIGGGDAHATIDLEVNHAAIATAPNAADELEQLGHRNPTASYQAKGPRGRSRLEHLVVRADHYAGGRQHGQHLRYTSRNHRLGDIEGRTRLFSSCPKGGPCEEHTNSEADNKRHDRDPNRAHTKIVGVGRAPFDQLPTGTPECPQAFGTCSRFVNHPHHSL